MASQVSSTLMGEPASTPSVSASASPEPAVVTEQPAATPEPSPVPDFDELQFPDETDHNPPPVAAQPGTDGKPAPTGDRSDLGELENADLSTMLPKDVFEKLLQSPRGQKYYKGFQLFQACAKPVEQGGLGFTPSVEQLKEFHQDSQDFRLMSHEFHNGSPEYAQNWVKQWFQPGPQGYSQGAMQVAKSFIPTMAGMAASNPQAAAMYREIATPVVLNYIEELYREAAQESTREDRITQYNVARIVEQKVTGKFRPVPEEALEPGYRATPATDPRQAEVDGKLKFINEFEQRQTQQANQQFEGAIGNAIYKNVEADTDHALKSLAEAYPKSTFAAIRKGFIDDVYRQVNSPQSRANLRNFTIARDEARRVRTPEAIEAAATAWRSVARPIVRQLHSQYMADNAPQIIARSNARNATLDEASTKRGTTGVVQSPQKNLAAGPSARQPGETYEQYMYRTTAALMA